MAKRRKRKPPATLVLVAALDAIASIIANQRVARVTQEKLKHDQKMYALKRAQMRARIQRTRAETLFLHKKLKATESPSNIRRPYCATCDLYHQASDDPHYPCDNCGKPTTQEGITF